MAENIQKVYPEGCWYDDSEKDRYDRVMSVMDRFKSKEYDKQDVRWFLKNAIINRVYFSESVFQNRHDSQCWKKPGSEELDGIIAEIENNGYASHKSLCVRRHFGKGLYFEHVVPFKLVLDKLIDLYNNNELTLDRFQKIKSNLNVCIITPKENFRLNKYRASFPKSIDWETGNEFARYDDVGIVIHGR